MDTLGAWLAKAATQLRQAGFERPRAEARYLACHGLNISTEITIAQPERPINDPERRVLDQILDRRLAFEPLAYIRGQTEFFGRQFSVGNGVLIPRPDSETLIDTALEAFASNQPTRILDLGTGSGCLLLTLLLEWPDSLGLGVDQSAAALAWAARNARSFGLMDRLTLIQGDWTTAICGRFDLIVSNPPYVERGDIPSLMPDVGRFEPHDALDGGTDGLDYYRRLAGELAGLLAPDGIALMECGAGQADAIEAFFAGAFAVRQKRDLAGTPRVIEISKNCD